MVFPRGPRRKLFRKHDQRPPVQLYCQEEFAHSQGEIVIWHWRHVDGLLGRVIVEALCAVVEWGYATTWFAERTAKKPPAHPVAVGLSATCCSHVVVRMIGRAREKLPFSLNAGNNRLERTPPNSC